MTPGNRRAVISTGAVGVVILAWAAVSHFGWTNPLFLPPPQEILTTARELLQEGYRQVPLWQHVLVSLARAVVAFAVATATGVPIGLMMGRSSALHAMLDPFVQFLRPLPKLALIPLMVVWFGIGELSKFLLIYLATFLTIVVSAAAAVLTVRTSRIRAAQALGVTHYKLFRYVILPSALPELFTGVRLGIGIGWTTLIAAEMIAASSGLGWMVVNASSYLRTDGVMLGILLLGITGFALDLLLVSLQRVAVPWMGKD